MQLYSNLFNAQFYSNSRWIYLVFEDIILFRCQNHKINANINKIDTHKISFHYYIDTFTTRYVSCLGKGDWGKTAFALEEDGGDGV